MMGSNYVKNHLYSYNFLWDKYSCLFAKIKEKSLELGILIGGFNPSENISQIGSFPQVGMKIKNI